MPRVMSGAEGARTVGVSPKLVAAIVTAMLTYVLGQEVLELPAWAMVVGQMTLVGGAVWQASPGRVEVPPVVAPLESSEPREAVRRASRRQL